MAALSVLQNREKGKASLFVRMFGRDGVGYDREIASLEVAYQSLESLSYTSGGGDSCCCREKKNI